MKLGAVSDDVYDISLKISLGHKGPEYPFAETFKMLVMNDGSVDTVDFGARQEWTAELEFVDLLKADYFVLSSYLTANVGSVIRFELENDAENPWGLDDMVGSDVFYASIVEWRDQGEADFSVNDSLYAVGIKLAWVGLTDTAMPNAADTSLYDFCVEIDTINASYINNELPDLPTHLLVQGGAIGYTTGSGQVCLFDGTTRDWSVLYVVADDDASLGFYRGVFYLSSFADISSSSTGAESHTWKSGVLNKDGIKFPNYNIDPRNGPAVERLEGFSFALNNSSLFHSFIVDNRINLYGAKVKLKAYDRSAGVMKQIRTGYNYKNSFDYSNYVFEVEPRLLNETKTFPEKTVGQVWTDCAKEQSEKPAQVTLGRWDRGRLQPVNFTLLPQAFPNGRRYFSHNSISSLQIRVNVDISEFSELLGYTASTYPAGSDTKTLYLQVKQQTGNADIGRMKKVTALASISSGVTGLTISSVFENPPDATTIYLLQMANVRLIVDDDPVVGLQANGYLKDSSVDAMPLELFSLNDIDELEEVPDHIYRPTDSDANQVTVDVDFLDVDNVGNVISNHAVSLQANAMGAVYRLIGELSSTYWTYDFGFTPTGPQSPDIKVTPHDLPSDFKSASDSEQKAFAKLFWSDDYQHARAVFSQNQVVILWTPSIQATTFTLKRYRYKKREGKTRVGVAGVASMSVTTSKSVSVTLDRTITGISPTQHFFVDNVGLNQNTDYEYKYVVYMVNAAGKGIGDIETNRGKCVAIPNGQNGLAGVWDDSSANLAWAVPSTLSEVKIYHGSVLIATRAGADATAGYYTVPGLSNDQPYVFKVAFKYNTLGTTADTWWRRTDAELNGAWDLKQLVDSSVTPRNTTVTDTDVNQFNQLLSWGIVSRTTQPFNGQFLPASALFTWTLAIDHKKLPDLSGAKDVRILADFVVRSYTGMSALARKEPVNFIIQARAIRRDGKSFIIAQYEAMQPHAIPDASGWGAYARFLNLPTSKGGNDANYDSDSSAPTSTGLYTGKSLWKIPDYLFEDDAQEWKEVDYIVFAVTNNDSVDVKYSGNTRWGYRLGIGGPPGQTWSEVAQHKSAYYLEFTKVFQGGLSKPQYARIDGGVTVEDAAVTGTASALIVEKAKHVTNYILKKTLGTVPTYIGNEMRGRDTWIWRLQTNNAMSVNELLLLLARNIWGCFTITPVDGLYLRTLDIEEPDVPTVFAFNDSNILKNTLSKPDFRKANEVFQKFKLRYNYEPVADDAGTFKGGFTEEMVVGWDLSLNRKIASGYGRQILDATTGVVSTPDGADEDVLAERCRVSTMLYTVAGKVNEAGFDQTKTIDMPMFYRPTDVNANTGEKVERDLPNLSTIHASAVQPKVAMQQLLSKYLRFNVYNSWVLSFKTHMKHVIHNTSINGLQDEAGTVDRRLKLMDKVSLSTTFHTGDTTVYGFVIGIQPDFYDGLATITLYIPLPPGVTGFEIDHVWDAGFGPRTNAQYVFPDTSYGLTNELGTHADASGPGTRVNSDYDFPDGSHADGEGTGNGR